MRNTAERKKERKKAATDGSHKKNFNKIAPMPSHQSSLVDIFTRSSHRFFIMYWTY